MRTVGRLRPRSDSWPRRRRPRSSGGDERIFSRWVASQSPRSVDVGDTADPMVRIGAVFCHCRESGDRLLRPRSCRIHRAQRCRNISVRERIPIPQLSSGAPGPADGAEVLRPVVPRVQGPGAQIRRHLESQRKRPFLRNVHQGQQRVCEGDGRAGPPLGPVLRRGEHRRQFPLRTVQSAHLQTEAGHLLGKIRRRPRHRRQLRRRPGGRLHRRVGPVHNAHRGSGGRHKSDHTTDRHHPCRALLRDHARRRLRQSDGEGHRHGVRTGRRHLQTGARGYQFLRPGGGGGGDHRQDGIRGSAHHSGLLSGRHHQHAPTHGVFRGEEPHHRRAPGGEHRGPYQGQMSCVQGLRDAHLHHFGGKGTCG
mmetsp:Transcript_24232/g.55169  ORF Transcript_24232/g.55169 Transcript_24232/m.55169 type:complete len:365 (+) Transcript_24232:142-1236(+)